MRFGHGLGQSEVRSASFDKPWRTGGQGKLKKKGHHTIKIWLQNEFMNCSKRIVMEKELIKEYSYCSLAVKISIDHSDF